MADGLAERYFQIPLLTRSYLTAAILTTGACALELVSPLALYFDAQLVLFDLQLWRVVTNFFFFGGFGLDFFFHMFFLVRYCRLLEEGIFRERTADFLVMLLFGAAFLCCVAPFINVPPFLGSSLAFMMVYLWARLNPYVRMSFLGLFTFRAPFLPWVLLGFSLMLGNSPSIDLMGILVGHVYYFLEYVYPDTPAGRGRKLLHTPTLLHRLVGGRAEELVPDIRFAPDAAVPDIPEPPVEE